MNVSGWEDPNLKPTLEKLLVYVRNNFVRDSYLQRMFDFRAKGLMQHVPMAAYLHAMDEAKTYKRKYHGTFYYSDFVDANKLRLLCLNFGELLGFKANHTSHELKSFSRHLLRGPLQGYLLNTAAYLGVYGHAGYRVGAGQEKFATFMITTFFSAIALSPLQYYAYRSWNNYNKMVEPAREIKLGDGVPGLRKPLYGRSGLLSYQRFFSFMPASVMSTTLYGLSVYLNNVDSKVLNLLYYPSLVLTYFSLNYAGFLMKAYQSETNFFKLREFTLPRAVHVNYPALAAFLALNTLLPLKVEQLRGRDEFKHAYLEFIADTEHFKDNESMYA